MFLLELAGAFAAGVIFHASVSAWFNGLTAKAEAAAGAIAKDASEAAKAGLRNL